MRSSYLGRGLFMNSAGIKTAKPKTGISTIDAIISLTESFDVAVAKKDEEIAGILLEQICIKVCEVQEGAVSGSSDFFARQAYLLHVHNVEAMDCMNLHRNLPPNWEALIARKQVIDGFVDEMHEKALEATGLVANPH